MMNKKIPPEKFGLHSRTVLEEIGKNHISIVIDRKSRIIMSDGKKILEKAEMIRKIKPEYKISIKITGPICSKTVRFLDENRIDII